MPNPFGPSPPVGRLPRVSLADAVRNSKWAVPLACLTFPFGEIHRTHAGPTGIAEVLNHRSLLFGVLLSRCAALSVVQSALLTVREPHRSHIAEHIIHT